MNSLFNNFGQLGISIEKIDITKAYSSIEREAEKWPTPLMKMFWEILPDYKSFRQFSIRPFSEVEALVQRILAKFTEEKISPGLAVILGCEHSMTVITLLQKKWSVIAIDRSQEVCQELEKLVNQFGSNWLDEKNLIIVCQDIETYEFPKNVRLILANDSLPYCHPTTIKELWCRAYTSLEKGGRIAGNFVAHYNDPLKEETQSIRRGGIWFTDKIVVAMLLTHKGYEIECCDYNKYWFETEPKNIEFIGRKF